MRTWEITIDFKDGKKVFVETGDIDKIITELERKYPDYNAVSYRVVEKGGQDKKPFKWCDNYEAYQNAVCDMSYGEDNPNCRQ